MPNFYSRADTTTVSHRYGKAGVSGACLELGQDGDEVLLGHGAEGGTLHGGATIGEDAALARDVLGSVDVVARNHAHRNACALARRNRPRHLLADRVLRTNCSSSDNCLKCLSFSHITPKHISSRSFLRWR